MEQTHARRHTMGEQAEEQPGQGRKGKMGSHRGMGQGRHGMMGSRRGGPMGRRKMRGRCPNCGQMVEMEEEAEGPYRGLGPAQPSSAEIQAIIEEELTADSWLDASDVRVSVEDGIVTLSGTVESRDAKRRAEALADQVLGVRDVQNTLQIAGL